jgi:hypothetical protein
VLCPGFGGAVERRTSPKFLGILLLDTRFPRPLGDVGNPDSFAAAGIPTRHWMVQGASPERVVTQADASLLPAFIAGAQALAADGAALIGTSCGFLVAHQAALQAAVSVPVLTSSLLLARQVANPGIVTIEAAALTDAVLLSGGVPTQCPVQGVEPGSEFHLRILGNHSQLDVAQAEADVVLAAQRLVQRHPAVQTIVLECTNMPPYRLAVERATGRRVVDAQTMLMDAWG